MPQHKFCHSSLYKQIVTRFKQGSHFSGLTKFPDFSLTFPVFFSIFQYFYNVLFFNLKLNLSILANNTQFI